MKIITILFISILIFSCTDNTIDLNVKKGSIQIIEKDPNFYQERNWYSFPPHTAPSNLDKRLRAEDNFFDLRKEMGYELIFEELKLSIQNRINSSDVFNHSIQKNIYDLLTKKNQFKDKITIQDKSYLLNTLIQTGGIEWELMANLFIESQSTLSKENQIKYKNHILQGAERDLKLNLNKVSKYTSEDEVSLSYKKMDEGDVKMNRNAIKILSN